jgi:leader peptidase (prepilin peptidase) / N-methyltransferase
MFIALAALLGLCAGSFLNVVIWRVPRHQSIVRPPSHCPVCARALTARENIPIVSWLVQRARCRGCRTPIAARYPLVELGGMGCAVLGTAIADSSLFVAAAFSLGFCGLLVVSVIELDAFTVPDSVVVWTVGLVMSCFAGATVVERHGASLGRASLGALATAAIVWTAHRAVPSVVRAIHVKVAMLGGVLMGWRSFGSVAVGLSIVVALVAFAVVLRPIERPKGEPPIQNFCWLLCAGCILGAVVGPGVVRGIGL